jgi:hypothetical protein
MYLHVHACILLYMHVVLFQVLIIGSCVLVYLKYNITHAHTTCGRDLMAFFGILLPQDYIMFIQPPPIFEAIVRAPQARKAPSSTSTPSPGP